jgi:hypothetical protein
MNKLIRQQKRAINREIGDNKWFVPDWQPMKFLRQQIDLAGQVETVDIYVNNIYQCIVRENNNNTQLSIKRHDKAAIHNWQHLQQIKIDICGEMREGIEIYPAMSRIVDTCNQYHIWVLREGMVNMGFKNRLVKLS